MTVGDAMTADPICVDAQTPLRGALALMDDHDFRHLPVASGGTLEGLVSERDLLEALGWMGGTGEHEDVLADERPSRVGQVMSCMPSVAKPGVPLAAAVAEMVARRIGCLPVVDAEGDGAVVGILTERDILRAFVSAVREGALPAGTDPVARELISTVLICASPATSVQDACSSCHAGGVRHLPVVKDGELVGIVSDRDLRAAARAGTHDALTVDEVMAREVETLDVEERLSSAARRMADLAVSSLPALEHGRLVGILTLTDVLRHVGKVMPR